MKTHFSAAQLAGVPGMPSTDRGVGKLADRESWSKRKRAGRGGGWEYPLTALPAETQAHLLAQAVSSSPVTAPSLTVPGSLPAVPVGGGLLSSPAPQPGQLKDWQRKCAEARLALLAEVKRLASAGGTDRAVMTLVKMADDGALPDALARLVPVANAKFGKAGKRSLTRTTLYRWMREADKGFAALAPKDSEKVAIPAWAPALMKLYGQPQKPSLAWCMEALPKHLPAGITAPSYHAANRFLKKVGNVERERGRHGPRELKALQPFVRRDSSHMWPGDCYTADGHTFDGEVAHPFHGKAFRPEITSVLDVATRKAVGWSAGLAESTWAVNDAMRHAVETHGINILFYVDRGSGYHNAAQQDEVVGFAARVGYEITHSLPYNSQARGLEERSHRTIWVRGAKQLPTFMGKDMDPQAKNKVYKLTRAHLKETGTSALLMAWADFLTWCQAQVDAYNARPHRSLPKIRDPHSGKMRHQSPNEAWQQALDEGWTPMMPADSERADLFRPYKVCKVLRGEVRLFNNLYFSADLEEYHNEQAQVGYDIHDPSRVWVRDMQGRLVCVAEWNANKRAYFPQSVIDQAAEKRAKAREKRLETHLQEVRDELNPPAMLEHQPSERIDLSPSFLHGESRVLQGIALEVDEPANVIAIAQATRPRFCSEPEKYRWLMQNKDAWTAGDAAWLQDYVQGEQYAELLERYAYQGLAWTAVEAERIKGFEVAAV